MKKRSVIFYFFVFVAMSTFSFFRSSRSEAGVKGSCANCHTMHNKQDGGIPEGGVEDPQPYLIKGEIPDGDENPCLGCHDKTTNAYLDANTPQIQYNYSQDEERKSLAGGTYYFVTDTQQEDDEKRSCRKGHNVQGLSDEDELIGIIPPGGSSTCIDGQQLTCAGTRGCHGDRSIENPLAAIKGGHHSPAQDNYRDGSTVATSYRMLLGVEGRVATEWEYGHKITDVFTWDQLKANENVNFYKGKDLRLGGLEGEERRPGDSHSINGLCGECHGKASGGDEHGFHSSRGISKDDSLSSPWLRHPTDVVMDKDDTEYWRYPNDESGNYSVEVPVGFTNVQNVANLQNSTRVVLCISCHRAHGSEYDDALRWDYEAMQSGAKTDNGCFRCHTDKDGN